MPNFLAKFELSASNKKKPVMYNFGPEGRDAWISAVMVSLENFLKLHNKRISSRPVKVTTDSWQCGSVTVGVDEELQSNSELRLSNGGITNAHHSASPDASPALSVPSTETPPQSRQHHKMLLTPPPLRRRFAVCRSKSAPPSLSLPFIRNDDEDDDVRHRKTMRDVEAVAEDALVVKPLSEDEIIIKRVQKNVIYISKTFLRAALLFVIFRIFVY